MKAYSVSVQLSYQHSESYMSYATNEEQAYFIVHNYLVLTNDIFSDIKVKEL